jgi:hypothetical protein
MIDRLDGGLVRRSKTDAQVRRPNKLDRRSILNAEIHFRNRWRGFKPR